jgi:hypothetical protein
VRYIVHLLPTEAQRHTFDDLRARVAEQIGFNRALWYPTAHLTLVWNIEDDPGDAQPIDGAALAAVLDRYQGRGTLPLAVGAPARFGGHVLAPVVSTEHLNQLRADLLDVVRRIIAGPNQRDQPRAERVREEARPHLTLAQDVGPEQAEKALAFLKRENLHAPRSVEGIQLALLARDPALHKLSRIVHCVPLALR